MLLRSEFFARGGDAQGGTGMKLLLSAYSKSFYPLPLSTLPARVDELPRVNEAPLLSECLSLYPWLLLTLVVFLYPLIWVLARSLLLVTGVDYRDTFILWSAGVDIELITLETGADGLSWAGNFFETGSNWDVRENDLFCFCFMDFANEEEGEFPESIAILNILRLNRLLAPESTGALSLSGDKLNCSFSGDSLWIFL